MSLTDIKAALLPRAVLCVDRPQWSLDYMGSTMMSPVVFTMIGVFVCFCYLARE